MQYLKIKKNVKKSKDWLTSCEVYSKPNRSFNHWRKQGKSNMFSEASRRTIKDLGSIELYELGQISKTVQ